MQRPDAQDCTNPLLWQVLPTLRERLFSGLNLPNETTMTLHERVVEILVELETQYVRNLAQYARYCNNAAPRTPLSTSLSRWPSFSPTSETALGLHGRDLGSPTSPVPDCVSAHLLPCSPLSAVIPSSPGTPHSNPASERITLNIGGKMFEATRDTWTAEPGSILDVLVSGRFSVQRCNEGAIYIDRDPKYFPFLMTYLRYRRDPLTRVTYRLSIAYFTLREQLRQMPSDCDRTAVLEEARFYGLQDFVHLFGTRPCIAMVGGYGPNSVFPVKTAEIFDLTRNEWEVNLPLSTLRGRFYTAAGVYQNQLYVIGGWDASTRHEFTVVEKFDPDTDEWSVVSQLPEYRMCHTCAVHEATGCIYVIGGATKTNQPLNTVWCWDIRTNVWTQLPLMKHARIFAACAVVNDHLWVIGGENKSEVLNTVEKFDLYKKEWSAGPSLPCARRAHAAVGLGNDVFVFGGNADRGFHNILATVEKIATTAKTPKWTSVRPMLHPRSYFSAVVCDGYIYAIGGDTLAQNVFRRADTVERYDAVMDCWVPRQPLNGFRSGQVCAVINLPIVKPRSLSEAPEFCPPPELDQPRSRESSDTEVMSPVGLEHLQ